MKKIVFRVDSGNHVGIGHVARCLTLAEELESNNYDIYFITKNHLGFAEKPISSKYKLFVMPGGLQKELTPDERNDYKFWLGSSQEDDLKLTNLYLEEIENVDLLIIDSYSLDVSYEKKVKAEYIMVIDDLYNRSHACDILLNQNIIHPDKSYSELILKPSPKYLMGPEFALLRSEFRTLRNSVNKDKFFRETKEILIFFGGKDVGGDTLKLVKSIDLGKLSKYNFTIIMDDFHNDYHEVQAILKNKTNVLTRALSSQFADLMIKADLFIGAGGATSWERASLGVASAIICVAENQIDNCNELSNTETAYFLGKSCEMNSNTWEIFFNFIVPENNMWARIRKNSFQLVDGFGTGRACTAITELLNDEISLKLRKVNEDDRDILLEWRNNPLVYKYALNPNPVNIEDHVKWFARALKSSNCFFYIAFLEEKKVGTVRYDLLSSENEAEVSITLAPEFWGKGLSSKLMNAAEKMLKLESKVKTIHARVLDLNKSSLKLFSRQFEKIEHLDGIIKFKKNIQE